MSIQLLVTGGTIDKQYDEINGTLVFSASHIPLMLQQARCQAKVSIQNLFLKDSLEISSRDRQQILTSCQSSKYQQIIITHGTDTMPETAALLGKEMDKAGNDKTIVLLGAMIPWQFKNSDALFNLGCAITAVQSLPPNIYLTMNGRIFNWNRVRKNKEKGIFNEI